MSNKALTYVFAHSKTKGSARVLMLAIADMSNDDGECYPGKANLAKKVNVSERHLTTLIHDCETLGELRVYQRSHSAEDHRTNKYYIAGLYDMKRIAKVRPAKAAKRRGFPAGKEGHRKSASGGGHGKLASGGQGKSASGASADGHGKSASPNPLLTTLPIEPKIAADAAPALTQDQRIVAIIDAWKKATHSMKGNPFANKTYRGYAETMDSEGITADDVTRFIEAQTKPGAYWHGKAVPFGNVAEHIGAWVIANPKQRASAVVKVVERPAEPTQEDRAEARRLLKEGREARRVSQ